MSSSPAWLTIALTSLSACDTPAPTTVLSSGIRALPAPHVLHHLNRWARHVWRPAVTPRALAALTRDPDAAQLPALGAGAVALLAALVDAVRRCNAQRWVDVLGVMFLADDPWAIEVGRTGDGKDVDRAAAAMTALYERKADALADVASKLTMDVREIALEFEEEGSGHGHGESFAELRCRVAALQLQLDDVTAVVRRNEKNTKDLLSSFHFWSMLLLDELRSYKSQLSERNAASAVRQEGSPGASGRTQNGDGVFDSFARTVSSAVDRIGPDSAAAVSERGTEGSRSNRGDALQRSSGVPAAGKPAPRLKRVFRDGKWVVL